ncbi:MAG: FtsX-like permease family protein [Planctomycetes bacterium]|nr:FtsX-like permease family protein [Planctomycetota bacterium]MCB9918270.1 FtsX-like permease family protein [Planctomycetota bacterium]
MQARMVWRNLMAHKLRTFLTFGAIVLAVFLLCFLRAAVRTLEGSVEAASSNRLMVQSAVSLFQDLPLAYENKMRAVPGVDWICKWQWFGGVYRERSNFFAQFGIDPETFLRSYNGVAMVEGTYEDFAQTKTGCLIGKGLAASYGFGVGDDIPLIGTIFTKADGSEWRFTVKAIYESTTPVIDNNTMFFHFEVLKDAVETGAARGPRGVGVYMLRLDDGVSPETVMAGVDTLFENGPQRVQTTTEAEFNRQFVTMLGGVPKLLGAIGIAVLFAIFFAVLNTMLMAARERTRSNGILKAMGFSDGYVFRSLLVESMVLALVGGVVGVVFVKLVEAPVSQSIGRAIGGFRVESSTMVIGLLLALGIGLAAGVVPAWMARRIEPVDAFRSEA